MFQVLLNKSRKQLPPKKQQLYDHLPLILPTILVRRTRHAGHCWISKHELINNVLLWTPTHGHTSVGQPARTYISFAQTQDPAQKTCQVR